MSLKKWLTSSAPSGCCIGAFGFFPLSSVANEIVSVAVRPLSHTHSLTLSHSLSVSLSIYLSLLSLALALISNSNSLPLVFSLNFRRAFRA